jgi:methionyl aminopeptidase
VIYKKSSAEIEIMRRGAKVLTDTLDRLEDALRPGITTADLDAIAEKSITAAGALASAKGYRGFPGSICTSPNDVVVHGIPGPVVLNDGDIVSLDVAVLYEGFHVDSAVTFPVGDVDAQTSELLKVTEEALEAAIAQCRPGNRLGDVGHAVEQVAAGAGFSVVREYVGHGVGRSFHEDPHVPNYGPPGRREVLGAGMTLAIEPMVNAGKPGTKVLSDGWTVVTADGSRSAHFEHTVAITLEGCEVLTRRAPR